MKYRNFEPISGGWRGYAFAIAAVVAASVLRWLLDPLLGNSLPFVTLFGAIAATAWVAGSWPALLATAIGYAVCEYSFVAPRGGISLSTEAGWARLLAYLLTSWIIIVTGRSARAARRRALREIAERAQAEQALRENERTHRLLSTIAILATRTRPHDERAVEDLVRGIMEAVVAELQVPRCGWARVDIDAGTITIEYDAHAGLPSMRGTYALAELTPAVIDELKAGRPVAIADATTDPRIDAVTRQRYAITGARAYITVPLHRQGRWVANFWVTTHALRAWKPGDVELVVAVAERTRLVLEQARVSAALSESEERFRTIADSAPVLMWLNDATGCVFVNRAYLDYLGLDEQTEVRGYDWSRFIHPEDRDGYVARYLESMEKRAPFGAEFRFRRHDGEYRWMHSAAIPRLAPNGEFLGCTGCTFDVHDARSAASAMQDADRRKDEFLAILSHELRNPLAPVRNAAHFLMMKDLADPELRKPVEMIHRQVAQMARLIDDLLDVSRITRGLLDLRFERFEFAEVMQQAVDACQDEVDARGHTLFVSQPERRIEMVADRHRLNQVFCNLIVNAAKYSPAGQRIDVTAFVIADRTLEVRVEDQGIGIPPGQLSEIFEMFMQVDRSFERHGGLGIGLTLARQLVELHGGTIEARSEGIGHGSTFIVRLPIAVPALAVMDSDPETPGAPAAQRILVADDNQDAAESLALLLRSGGHVVREALDGETALHEAAVFLPTVAFIDIGMPKVSGYDVARSLRAQPWGRAIHLVALTGWGQDEDRRRSAEAGFDDHVVKPVSHEDLTKLLRAVASRRAAGESMVQRGA